MFLLVHQGQVKRRHWLTQAYRFRWLINLALGLYAAWAVREIAIGGLPMKQF